MLRSLCMAHHAASAFPPRAHPGLKSGAMPSMAALVAIAARCLLNNDAVGGFCVRLSQVLRGVLGCYVMLR